MVEKKSHKRNFKKRQLGLQEWKLTMENQRLMGNMNPPKENESLIQTNQRRNNLINEE